MDRGRSNCRGLTKELLSPPKNAAQKEKTIDEQNVKEWGIFRHLSSFPHWPCNRYKTTSKVRQNLWNSNLHTFQVKCKQYLSGVGPWRWSCVQRELSRQVLRRRGSPYSPWWQPFRQLRANARVSKYTETTQHMWAKTLPRKERNKAEECRARKTTQQTCEILEATPNAIGIPWRVLLH